MVQILGAYSGRSGNTEQLARAVARGAEQAGAGVTVKRASEVAKDDLVAARLQAGQAG